jgi:hypothetical protein
LVRGIVELGNFSLHFEVPWQNRPLVKRRNRIPITERIIYNPNSRSRCA